MTRGLILKSALFEYFFLFKYVSKLLRLFFFFTKSFFLLDFQKYLNLTQPAKRRFLCRLCTLYFHTDLIDFHMRKYRKSPFFSRRFSLNFGVIYTMIFQIFTCEIIENILIYLFKYFEKNECLKFENV